MSARTKSIKETPDFIVGAFLRSHPKIRMRLGFRGGKFFASVVTSQSGLPLCNATADSPTQAIVKVIKTFRKGYAQC